MMEIMTGEKMPPRIGWWRAVRVLTLLAAVSSGAAMAQANAGSKPAESAPAGSAAADKQAAPAQEHQPVHSDNSYLIGADDVLEIDVYKEQEVSRTVLVRADGKISLPLAGELMAGGRTPLQLEQEIANRLKDFISEPVVAVIVKESKSRKINILGMVIKPGAYLLTGSTTVLDAIAMAGGFKDFAKQKSIYVLRKGDNGAEQRLPFNYKDVIKGKNTEQNILLQPNDSVVVP
jgi:polysaccharide export outer membrane protein